MYPTTLGREEKKSEALGRCKGYRGFRCPSALDVAKNSHLLYDVEFFCRLKHARFEDLLHRGLRAGSVLSGVLFQVLRVACFTNQSLFCLSA